MSSFDCIVIGGGTNGLACAHRLAGSGKRVVVVEANPISGGGASTVEFAPGYRVSGLAHTIKMLDRRVAAAMALAAHGLEYSVSNMGTVALSTKGNHLTFGGTFGSHLTGADAANVAAWKDLRTRLMNFASVLAPFREMTPPRIARKAGNPNMKLAAMGLGLRRLGRKEFREFMRMILINVADVLEDDLTDDRLMGLLAFDAGLGAWLGPRSPNSLILLLNQLAGEVAGVPGALALPAGGMGAVANAMVSAVLAQGIEVRTSARVQKILVEGDRASGVLMTNGEQISARIVISAINPTTTLQALVGPAHLDTGFVRSIRAIRSRGGAAKLHLALNGPPDFHGADLSKRLVIAPSVHAVETAFNAVKYGEVPDHPVLEIVLPSAHDNQMAPDGHHVLSAIVQFAPHDPRNGLVSARKAMLHNTIAVLERYSPGIAKLVTHSELLMPQDIAERYGMVGGNWHHGELAVEQMLFLRPVIGAAQYSTPLPGLWLAGAGSHPGGGISGAAGWNAAGQIIAEGRE